MSFVAGAEEEIFGEDFVLEKNLRECEFDFPKDLPENQRDNFCRFQSLFKSDSEKYIQLLKDSGFFNEHNWKKNIKHIFNRFLNDGSAEYDFIWNNIRKTKKLGRNFLDIFDFSIRRLPTNIIQLNLVTLTISDTDIKSLPLELFEIKTMKKMEIKKSPIYEIQPEIGNLVKLESLQLSRLRLVKLPNEITNLKKLKDFDISFNYIEQLSPEIIYWIYSTVENFDAQVNWFDFITSCLPQADVSNLKRLNLSETKILSPINFAQFPKLISLLISDIHTPLSFNFANTTCCLLEYIQLKNDRMPQSDFEQLLSSFTFINDIEANGAVNENGASLVDSLFMGNYPKMFLKNDNERIIKSQKNKKHIKAIKQEFLKTCSQIYAK